MNTPHLTPLMKQYFEIKEQYPDTLLFFQVGDFYELFFEDAKIAASFLAITLTARGKNNGKDIPLCGIPVHALQHYLKKLVSGGFKVALCDQLSKPQPGQVVERGVTNVFTPGTLTDEGMLDDKSASYLLAFFPAQKHWGMIFSELLTAQLFATQIPAGDYRMVESELIRFFPDEIILPFSKSIKPFEQYFKRLGYCASFANHDNENASERTLQWVYQQFNQSTQQQITKQSAINQSLTVLHTYLAQNQNKSLNHFKSIQFYQPDDYVILDAATQKNLDLIENNYDGERKNSLISVIDQAKTPMGSRTIKKWLQRPLIQKGSILQRQEVVGTLCNNLMILQQLEDLLTQLSDLERIIGRIGLRRAVTRDYVALKDSLMIIPQIKDLILQHMAHTSLGQSIAEKLHDLSGLVQLLDTSINDDYTSSIIIKRGFNHRLDRLRSLVDNGKEELQKLENQEVAATGINSLKIGYNNISGYYIEITNPNLHLVPTHYVEQQKLANRKRFVTSELQKLEQELLKATTEIDQAETEVYESIKNEVEKELAPLRHIAQALAYLDALFGFAHLAYHHNYRAPLFNDHHEIVIKGGRHPIIEQTLSSPFIKNDTNLTAHEALLIITGPNMGGKSTYLRQVALLCILAQCGSFIPVDYANLPILDRIFTRIGSADNLAEGKSTFLVEMEETATICTRATKQSLVILDEVGRGTSTFDGMALAQAIIEYIVQNIQAKCLFATHYHELTALSEKFSAIKNYHMACKKSGEKLHFMHTIIPGVAHASFGLDVARLAQLPEHIINRASEILTILHHEKQQGNKIAAASHYFQQTLSPEQARQLNHYKQLMQQLHAIDLNTLSPKKAFDLIWELASKQAPAGTNEAGQNYDFHIEIKK